MRFSHIRHAVPSVAVDWFSPRPFVNSRSTTLADKVLFRQGADVVSMYLVGVNLSSSFLSIIPQR